MRYDSFQGPPVRLGIERQAPNIWSITRAGHLLGLVMQREGKWYAQESGRTGDAVKAAQSVRYTWSSLGHTVGVECSSFRTAVLKVTRYRVWADSDGPQDYGQCRAVRVCVNGEWFVFVQTRWYTGLFLDFPEQLKNPSPMMQAMVHKAYHEALKVLGPEIDKAAIKRA